MEDLDAKLPPFLVENSADEMNGGFQLSAGALWRSSVLGKPRQQTQKYFSSSCTVLVFAPILEKKAMSSGLCWAKGAMKLLLLLAMSLVLPFTNSGAFESLSLLTDKMG